MNNKLFLRSIFISKLLFFGATSVVFLYTIVRMANAAPGTINIGAGNAGVACANTEVLQADATGKIACKALSALTVGLATTATNVSGGSISATTGAFSGEVTGITKTMVGLGNVANESKATMFTNPTFTGTVTGVSKSMVGLGNVTNESKATMFTNPTFTGTATSPLFSATSDVRYKENIQPLSSDILNKIQLLRGVTYRWKDEYIQKNRGLNDKTQIGVIAQEVEGIFPELVTTSSTGYKSVAYDSLAPLLIEAVKEQQQEIESLSAKIKSLQNDIQIIKARLEQNK